MNVIAAFRFLVIVITAMALSACDGYPRDPEGTAHGIIDRGVLRTGLIVADADRGREQAMATKIASSVGASADYRVGSAEVLMRAMEQKKLDVVIGMFAKDSPWGSRVVFSKPFDADNPKSSEPVQRAALRRGENRWLLQVEKVLSGGDQ